MTTEFSINQWFNSHPIRIVGSPEEPFFYAEDLAIVLGFENIDQALSNVNRKDIVSPKPRRKQNITTYRLHEDTMVADPTVVLLTESGAYKMIISSKSSIARPFQDHIFSLICKKKADM